MKKKILIVDDDQDIVLMLTDRIQLLGYESLSASDGKQALEVIEKDSAHLMLLDLEMPRMSGLEVLHQLAKQKTGEEGKEVPSNQQGVNGDDLPVIVMTAHGTIAKAVEAMKAGALDFLTKPIDLDHLSLVVKKALEREALKREVTSLRQEVESRYSTIVGNSPCMTSTIDLAKRAAQADAMVLLLGESGTGKELFARSIHQWSPRRMMPFSIINCVALTDTLLENELFGHEKGAFTGADSLKKGKIEEADGGTLFLDEIGDMPSGLQAKLLRVLQDHEFPRVGGTRLIKVNIRIIAATNKDLKKAVKNGTFREDLFFRLNVVSLSLPPLRDRPEDIVPLAEFFLSRHVREMKKPVRRFSKAAMKAMREYAWPGNIRELDNAIARAVVLGADEFITPDQLSFTPVESETFLEGENLPYHQAIGHFSCHILEQAMKRSNWSQTKAAELLQLQRTYLSRLLKQKNIHQGPPEG
jgi:DNA-binding NtrC family response regulator